MRLPEIFRRQPTTETLYKWNLWLAGLYALQAVAALVVGSAQPEPLSASYLTYDSLQSSTSGSYVLAPASHHLFDLNLLIVVFVVFLVLAAVHVSQATWLKVRYEAQLKQNFNAFRWAAFGVTASLLFLVLAILSGADDVMTLILLLVLGVLLHALCIGVERMAALRGRARTGVWFGFGLVVLAGAGVWAIVASYLFGASLFGDGHIPAHVYWLALTAALTALSFAFGLYRQIMLAKTGSRYHLTEQRYTILTLVTTSLLAWQIVAGTMH